MRVRVCVNIEAIIRIKSEENWDGYTGNNFQFNLLKFAKIVKLLLRVSEY